jgi:adenosylhomocysteine nucleosidase
LQILTLNILGVDNLREHFIVSGTRWIALLAAVHSEVSGLVDRFEEIERYSLNGISGYITRVNESNFLLLETGIGPEHAERTAREAMEHFPISMVVSFGYAGGLSPRLKAGSLVLCKKIYSSDPSQRGNVIYSDPDLLDVALDLRIPNKERIILGNSLTVDEVLLTPGYKRALWRKHNLHIVEMESYWAGKVCAEYLVPFLAIRSVSDLVDQRLPDMRAVTETSGDIRWTAARLLISHPYDWPTLPNYFRNLLLAQHSLTEFMDALVESKLGKV